MKSSVKSQVAVWLNLETSRMNLLLTASPPFLLRRPRVSKIVDLRESGMDVQQRRYRREVTQQIAGRTDEDHIYMGGHTLRGKAAIRHTCARKLLGMRGFGLTP